MPKHRTVIRIVFSTCSAYQLLRIGKPTLKPHLFHSSYIVSNLSTSKELCTWYANVQCMFHKKMFSDYGTTQMQGNVCACLTCVFDAYRVWWNRAWQLFKSCCSFIARLCACTDASHECSGHISRMSWTHLARLFRHALINALLLLQQMVGFAKNIY